MGRQRQRKKQGLLNILTVQIYRETVAKTDKCTGGSTDTDIYTNRGNRNTDRQICGQTDTL